MKNKKSRVIAAVLLLCAAAFILIAYRGGFGKRLQEIFNPATVFDTSQDFVKIMDVGQADSILIYSNGCSAVIDAGLASSVNDISLDLKAANIKDIDALLITHQHMDHAGGLPDIAKRFKIDNLILPELDENAEAAQAISAAKRAVSKQNGKLYTYVRGMNFDIGEFTVTVLGYYGDMKDENNRSAVIMTEIDGIKFLFTGDAEGKTERALLSDGINVDCDVLKVGHHGSNSSTAKDFLKAATPEYAAISVGENNVYSHPDIDVVSSLKNSGARVFRTDKNGDITFYVENGKIRTETEE